MTIETTANAVVITPEEMREHWLGHRHLTRRVIEAFPEDELFNYSIGGMRTFAELSMELIRMGGPIARGAATGEWVQDDLPMPKTRDALLRLWDESTGEIDAVWSEIPPARFHEVDAAFGQWEAPVYTHILYAIDNENHHRGQGYVYLRSLGVEPPPFYDR